MASRYFTASAKSLAFKKNGGDQGPLAICSDLAALAFRSNMIILLAQYARIKPPSLIEPPHGRGNRGGGEQRRPERHLHCYRSRLNVLQKQKTAVKQAGGGAKR